MAKHAFRTKDLLANPEKFEIKVRHARDPVYGHMFSIKRFNRKVYENLIERAPHLAVGIFVPTREVLARPQDFTIQKHRHRDPVYDAVAHIREARPTEYVALVQRAPHLDIGEDPLAELLRDPSVVDLSTYTHGSKYRSIMQRLKMRDRSTYDAICAKRPELCCDAPTNKADFIRRIEDGTLTSVKQFTEQDRNVRRAFKHLDPNGFAALEARFPFLKERYGKTTLSERGMLLEALIARVEAGEVTSMLDMTIDEMKVLSWGRRASRRTLAGVFEKYPFLKDTRLYRDTPTVIQQIAANPSAFRYAARGKAYDPIYVAVANLKHKKPDRYLAIVSRAPHLRLSDNRRSAKKDLKSSRAA